MKYAKQAKPLSDYATKLLDPILQKRTGLDIDLFAIWAELAGDEYRECSRPHKLIWPKIKKDEFQPATLVVACVIGYGLFLQHDSQNLLNRINAYFGYSAIGKIKIIDDIATNQPKQKKRLPELNEQAKTKLENVLQNITSLPHKQALKKWGQDIYSKRSSL